MIWEEVEGVTLNNRHGKKGQLCVYCNLNAAEERDHVPPKSFFTKPRPSNLVVVPICSRCNREFGRDLDEPMRGFLIQRMAYKSPSATTVWKEMVLEGLRKNRRMARQMNAAHTRVGLRSPGGLYLGKANAVIVPKELFEAFIKRLVNGLYWHCFGVPIGEHCRIQAYWAEGEEFQDEEVKAWIDTGPLHTHAGGQFKFKVFGQRPDDLRQFWVFELHGQVIGAAVCTWEGLG